MAAEVEEMRAELLVVPPPAPPVAVPPPLPPNLPPPLPPEARGTVEDPSQVSEQDLREWAAYDTETYRFFPGRMAPKIVCASVAGFYEGQIRGALLVGETEAVRVARDLFKVPCTCPPALDMAGRPTVHHVPTCARRRRKVVFANAAYDLAVLVEARPEMRWAIFQALREGRVYDVLIAEALNAIYGGHLGKSPSGAPMYNAATGRVVDKYSLATVVQTNLGRVDSKDNDDWRMSYALLDGVPEALWPKTAGSYPVDDARNTLEVAIAQVLGPPGLHRWKHGVCQLCGAVSGSQVSPACSAAPRSRPHQNLENLPAQVEADFAATLGSYHSFRTDPERVEALIAEAEELHVKAVARFQKKGWIREDGSEDQSAVKKAVARAYGAKTLCPRCGGKGRIARTKREGCRGVKVKNRYQGCGGPACIVCRGVGEVELPAGDVTCKNEWDDAGTKVLVKGCDGTGFDLDSVRVLPRTDKLGVRTDRDAKSESGDEDLADYGNDQFEKTRTTFGPYLRKGYDRPLPFNIDILKATGRMAVGGSPLHQFPRAGKERRCIRARGPWCGYPHLMWLGSTDYAAGELCLSGKTRILTSDGYREIADLAGHKVSVVSVFSDDTSFVRNESHQTALVFKSGEKPTLIIETVDGRRISATENHPFLVQRVSRTRQYRNITFDWVKSGDLKVGDSLVSGSVDLLRNTNTVIDSKFYTFGHFVGDGWFCKIPSTGRISVGACASGDEKFLIDTVVPVWRDICSEAECFIENAYDNRRSVDIRVVHSPSHFSRAIETVSNSPGVYHFSVTKPHVARLLQKRYGFVLAKAPQKRFPACYWSASRDQKASFLRGLFDADGSIVTVPRRSVSLTAANEELAREVLLALSEFGIDARMTTHYIRSRDRKQTIVQVRGYKEIAKFYNTILFVDTRFKSVKAERLLTAVPKQKQDHYSGFKIRSITAGPVEDVYNLDVPGTRHYIAEGVVVHNCTLAEATYALFGYSKMRDTINRYGDPGVLHSETAAEVMGISLEEFLKRLHAKDVQAKYFRQASKPDSFGKPALMGAPKIVWTNRKESAGFTPCEGGPARNDKGEEGYHGIRFCVLVGGAKRCGETMITSWGKRGYPCVPVCKRCVEIEAFVITPAYFRRFPEIKDYHRWVIAKTDRREPAPSIVWDAQAQAHRIIRLRGGCDVSTFANNIFQSMLADITKAAYVRVTRECYLGVKDDGSPSPLAGCYAPLMAHDEIISELIAETAHLSGPRISEIMLEEGYRVAPHVTWKADTALMDYWYKQAEPVVKDGRLMLWQPKALAS